MHLSLATGRLVATLMPFGEELAPLWAEAEAGGWLTVFQSWAWLTLWQQTVGTAQGLQPFVIRVDDATGQPLLLWPLVRRRVRGLWRIEGMDAGVSDYHAPVLLPGWHPDLAPAAVAAAVKVLPPADLLHLPKLPARVGEVDNPLLALPHAPMHIVASAVILGDDWNAFYAGTLSGKNRKIMRRKRRGLAEMGEVRIAVAASAQERERLLPLLLDLKRQRCAAMGWGDLLAEPAMQDFYRGLAASPLGHLSSLSLDGRPLAINLGVVHGGRFHLLLPTFEPGPWDAWSCGRQLFEADMEWSTRHGCPVFDLTIGDESYKATWKPRGTAMHEALLGLSWPGRGAAGLLRARRWAGRLRRRWRSGGAATAAQPAGDGEDAAAGAGGIE